MQFAQCADFLGFSDHREAVALMQNSPTTWHEALPRAPDQRDQGTGRQSQIAPVACYLVSHLVV